MSLMKVARLLLWFLICSTSLLLVYDACAAGLPQGANNSCGEVVQGHHNLFSRQAAFQCTSSFFCPCLYHLHVKQELMCICSVLLPVAPVMAGTLFKTMTDI